ncbi:bifunctional riboflavin kinase/FAD synthetase [Glaciecola sp. 2405UD65-10]|uniref:bifunctional riboflavin kinase/FAD synthetase n=1 Tax=Glaciecola sp. 2405UD65-10 TaxID=3397244 RepID=UPI003B5CB559
MELIRGLHNIGTHHHGCVLTIGKFDGVHLGHQAVLKSVLQKAEELNLPAVVMVFEPQPEELFSAERAPARLSLLKDKYIALRDIGVHRLLCVRFTRDFSAISPQSFIHDLLIKQLGVKFLVVGDDFRFGYKREGDFDMLRDASETAGFDVVSTQSFKVHDCRISSTAVRTALSQGDFEGAKEMLGGAYVIRGKVVHGEKNGRTIGYPTANVLMRRHKSPVKGVFAGLVKTKTGIYNAVINVGNRPTLNGQRMQLEAHLFDFDGDLYGQNVEVELLKKIRDEIKFPDFQVLKQQINKDATQARSLLANFE